MKKKWFKSKTIWFSALLASTAAGAFAFNEISLYQLLTTIFGTGVAAGFRDAMKS